MNRRKDMFWRQLDIVDIDKLQKLEVSVIGCGGIGSPTLMALAKMGIETIAVFDKDIIEDHNIPNQMHLVDLIGEKKVVSSFKIVKDLTGVILNATDQHFVNQKLLEVTVVGTDTMSSRKQVFLEFMKQDQTEILIDARMAGQFFNIFYVNKQDKVAIEKYKTTIVRDNEAAEEKCTEKAIIYNTFGIAAFICNIIKKIVNKEHLQFKYVFDFNSWLLQAFEVEDYESPKRKGELYINTKN